MTKILNKMTESMIDVVSVLFILVVLNIGISAAVVFTLYRLF